MIAASIQIEGVHLTPEAIDQLKNFQDNGNEALNNNIEYITDLTFFLINSKDLLGKDQSEAIDNHLKTLGLLRSELLDLRKH